MASSRRLRLIRTPQVQTVVGSVVGYKVVVTASEGNLIDNNVFRMHRRPVNPLVPAGDQTDDFDGVCTVEELSTLPVGAPATGGSYFRTNQLTLSYATQELGDSAWTGIKADVDALVLSLDLADQLGPPEIHWAGTPPA